MPSKMNLEDSSVCTFVEDSMSNANEEGLVSKNGVSISKNMRPTPTECPVVCLLSQSHFKPKLVSLLLDEDANDDTSSVNYIDEEQRTYLWFCRTVEACKFLIDRGVNINHVRLYGHFNEYRETVLDHMSKKSFEIPEVMAYLISCHAKYSRELL